MPKYSYSQLATVAAAAAAAAAAAIVARKLLINRIACTAPSLSPPPSDDAQAEEKSHLKLEHTPDNQGIEAVPHDTFRNASFQGCIQTRPQKQRSNKTSPPRRELAAQKQPSTTLPQSAAQQPSLQHPREKGQQQQHSHRQSREKKRELPHASPQLHRVSEQGFQKYQHQLIGELPSPNPHDPQQHSSNLPLQWVVFWDLENVAVPRGVTGHSFVHSLCARLTSVCPGKIVRIVAAGNMFRLPVHLCNQLQASGVSLNHIETRGRKDAADKALITEICLLPSEHPPPFGVALLTGDSDFAYALARMRHLGCFTVVVASTREKIGALLKGAGNVVWGLREDVLKIRGNLNAGQAHDKAEMEQLKGSIVESEAELNAGLATQNGKQQARITEIEAKVERRKQQPQRRLQTTGSFGTEGGGRDNGRWQIRTREAAGSVVVDDLDAAQLTRLLSLRHRTHARMMVLRGCVVLTVARIMMRKSLLKSVQFDIWMTGVILGGLILVGLLLIVSSWRGDAKIVISSDLTGSGALHGDG